MRWSVLAEESRVSKVVQFEVEGGVGRFLSRLTRMYSALSGLLVARMSLFSLARRYRRCWTPSAGLPSGS
jgi:hypothetical protein